MATKTTAPARHLTPRPIVEAAIDSNPFTIEESIYLTGKVLSNKMIEYSTVDGVNTCEFILEVDAENSWYIIVMINVEEYFQENSLEAGDVVRLKGQLFGFNKISRRGEVSVSICLSAYDISLIHKGSI